MELEYNKYQTPLTDDLKKSLPKEVWDEVTTYLESVKFIKNLVAKDRPYIKDRPVMTYKDEEENDVPYEDGRKIIDLTNPHILDDMDYFREKAIFFEANGRYTNIIPNSNPKSEYAAFWREEVAKWKHGQVRADGEWIPGELYFYWNYAPIWLSEVAEGNKNKKQGERVRKFPKPWLGDYLFFHYVAQAKANGQHGKLLKTRGVGFSFKAGAWSPRNMYVYPGSGNPNFHLASEKGFLTGDKGIWGKVLDTLDWIAEHTPLARMRLVDGKRAMEVQLGYEDEYGSRKGNLASVFGISLKDNPDKARGIRGPLIHYEEDGLFPNLEKAWGVNRKAVEDGDVAFGFMLAGGTGGCLTADNQVHTADGDFISVKDLRLGDKILGYDKKRGKISIEDVTYVQPYSEKECLKITTNTGRTIECSEDHPIYSFIKRKKTHNVFDFVEAKNLRLKSKVCVPDIIDVFGKETMEYPRLMGVLVGDGSYGYNQTTSLHTDDSNIKKYIESNFNFKKLFVRTGKNNLDLVEYSIHNIRPILREIGIVNQTKLNKRLPDNIHKSTKNTICEFLSGYYDADGYVNIRKTKPNRYVAEITLTSIVPEIITNVQHLLHRLGIHSRIRKRLPRKNKIGIQDVNPWYELTISDKRSLLRFCDSMSLLIHHKQERLNKIKEVFSNIKEQSRDKDIRTEKIVKIEKTGIKPVYNLTANTTNTYLGNGIITHNTEGASFEGSEKLFYNPGAYNIYGIPNVYDKNTDGGTSCGFFWGAYLNRNGCYDLANGEPDVVQALIEICRDRHIVKYGSSDASAITQKKAEEPVTPQEAVMRTEGTVFPVSDLKEYLEAIMPRREAFLAEHYVGELVTAVSGEIDWRPNSDVYPLRSYDHSSGDRTGALEIFEMPKRNANGEVIRGRYIAGIDPIDADAGGSLFSMLVMDTFTDRIVAEYSGRPRTAKAAYEMALRTLKYYNAEANYESNLKGLFSYFDSKNALHYLADTPQVLKDMELVKQTNLYGNKAKGTHANPKINSWGRQLQADWMLTEIYAPDDEDDNRLNLHRLRSLPYVEECIYWNADGNFDRVSAGILLFILREDRFKRTLSAKENQFKKVNKIANDPFFSRNYNSKESSFRS